MGDGFVEMLTHGEISPEMADGYLDAIISHFLVASPYISDPFYERKVKRPLLHVLGFDTMRLSLYNLMKVSGRSQPPITGT